AEAAADVGPPRHAVDAHDPVVVGPFLDQRRSLVVGARPGRGAAPALDEQDALAGQRALVRRRSPARPAADHDDVKIERHRRSGNAVGVPRAGTMIRRAPAGVENGTRSFINTSHCPYGSLRVLLGARPRGQSLAECTPNHLALFNVSRARLITIPAAR